MSGAAELRSYVPARVARQTVGAAHVGAIPRIERLSGALLFADVVGSTALADRLAEQGPVGAEQLRRALNALFAPVVATVLAHGGDVLKFAGDGVLALWDDAGGTPDLVESVQRATQCGLAL